MPTDTRGRKRPLDDNGVLTHWLNAVLQLMAAPENDGQAHHPSPQGADPGRAPVGRGDGACGAGASHGRVRAGVEAAERVPSPRLPVVREGGTGTTCARGPLAAPKEIAAQRERQQVARATNRSGAAGEHGWTRRRAATGGRPASTWRCSPRPSGRWRPRRNARWSGSSSRSARAPSRPPDASASTTVRRPIAGLAPSPATQSAKKRARSALRLPTLLAKLLAEPASKTKSVPRDDIAEHVASAFHNLRPMRAWEPGEKGKPTLSFLDGDTPPPCSCT